MKVFVVSSFVYDGREVPAGVHEVSDSEAHGLFIAGPARPATSTEIEEAADDAPAVETAALSPTAESATGLPQRRAKRRQ